MLELSIRDVGIKGKKLRNKGLVTGTLIRKEGQIIPIFLPSNRLEQYIVITDYCKDLDVKFENEIIHVHIKWMEHTHRYQFQMVLIMIFHISGQHSKLMENVNILIKSQIPRMLFAIH